MCSKITLVSLVVLLCAGCPASPGAGASGGAVADDPLDFLASLPSVTLVSLDPTDVEQLEAERQVAEALERERAEAAGEPPPTPTPAASPSPAPAPSSALLRGYRILGSTELSGAEQRRAVQAVRSARDESKGIMASCFSPRHALRGEQDGRRVELVICFECWSMLVYDGEGSPSTVPITPGGEAALSRLLDAAGVQRDHP